MPIMPFHPRLTKAGCEFWFEAGADWQEHTERLMESSLALAFADAGDIAKPFLWFEPNYLAIHSEPLGNEKAHLEVQTHSQRVMRALKIYADAAHPCRVQSLFLQYHFDLPADSLPGTPKKLIWNTPREMLTLERRVSGREPQTRLALRCLITQPSDHCLARSGRWLEHIHQRMDTAFHDLRQSDCLVEGRR